MRILIKYNNVNKETLLYVTTDDGVKVNCELIKEPSQVDNVLDKLIEDNVREFCIENNLDIESRITSHLVSY